MPTSRIFPKGEKNIQKFLFLLERQQPQCNILVNILYKILCFASRLEAMGAPPAAAKSVRSKYKNSSSETPGEVLGNFFLSYKKDRQDMLAR